jgi:hypothetical protein
MYVTVSLKIEVDATATLTDLEHQIQEAGRATMQAAFKQVIHQREVQQQTCPACGSGQTRSQGTKRRVLLTSFGRVEVPLQRRRCRSCGQRFRPAEACLGEVRGHLITPALRELATLVGSSWPYQTAAGILKRLSGVHLSSERLRYLTNEEGTRQAQRQQAQAQQGFADAMNPALIRRERAEVGPAAPAPQPEWLQVGLDGGWVPSREQPGGMEGKIGLVASQVEPVGTHGRRRLSQRRSVATFGEVWEVGQLTYAAACALGATQAQQQVVLGDGADWIKTQANEHFPDAVKSWTGPICGAQSRRQCVRFGLATTLPAAPGASSNMRCCCPCCGAGSAPKRSRICGVCAHRGAMGLRQWRTPSALWRPSRTGWAIMPTGRSRATRWAVAWSNARWPWSSMPA